MGRLKIYKSPAKQKRNTSRLVRHIKKLTLIENKAKPSQLGKSLTVQTYYPNPCHLCNQYQCDVEKHTTFKSKANLEHLIANMHDQKFDQFEARLEKAIKKTINDLSSEEPPT